MDEDIVKEISKKQHEKVSDYLTNEERKILAIIRGVKYEMEDHCGYNCLFFHTEISEGSGALQVLAPTEAEQLCQKYGFTLIDYKKLEGKPIWVIFDNALLKIYRSWKI